MPDSPYTVVYAGVLSPRKNAFLYQVGNVVRGYKVRLYGGGFDMRGAVHPECFEQMGFVPSSQLIATARDISVWCGMVAPSTPARETWGST